jgi:hypothetical protein
MSLLVGESIAPQSADFHLTHHFLTLQGPSRKCRAVWAETCSRCGRGGRFLRGCVRQVAESIRSYCAVMRMLFATRSTIRRYSSQFLSLRNDLIFATIRSPSRSQSSATVRTIGTGSSVLQWDQRLIEHDLLQAGTRFRTEAPRHQHSSSNGRSVVRASGNSFEQRSSFGWNLHLQSAPQVRA